MESAFGKGVVYHPLQGKDPRSFELLEGGRELALVLKDTLIFGHSFAFLTPEWAQIPLVSSILRAAGITDSSARVLPFFGDGELLLPGLRARQRPLLRKGMFSIWTDRETYRADKDWVQIFVFAPHLRGESKELVLLQGEKPVGGQAVQLDEFGIGTLQIQGLPVGEYRLFCPEQGISNRFLVALYQRPLLESRWVQQYIRQTPQTQKRMLVFVLQLSSFGAPFQGDVGINLLKQVNGEFQPVLGDVFRADGVGRIAGELPLDGEGVYTLEVQSLQDPEKRTFLPVDSEGTEPLQQILNPLGRLTSWHWLPEAGGPWGMAIQPLEQVEDTPIVWEAQQGSHLWLRCQRPLTDLTVQLLDPLHGRSELLHWPLLEAGQVIDMKLPEPAAVLLLGALEEGRPWEGWTATLPQTGEHLELQAPQEVKPGEPLTITLESSLSELRPVFVMITEEQEESRPIWGPAATLQGAMKEVLEGLRVGGQRENYRVVDIRAAESRPAGRPGTIPPPSSPPPPGAASSPGDTQEIVSWEPPPLTAEHFPRLLFAGLVPVEGKNQIEIWPGQEAVTLRIEAVLLDEHSPTYAARQVEVCEEHFLELLGPDMVSDQLPATGELVVFNRAPSAYIEALWNGQPLSLWQEDHPVDVTTHLPEGLHQLRCQLLTGHYQFSLRSPEGTLLASLERQLERWGERRENGLSLQLQETATPAESKGEDELLYALQLLIANIIQRPPGNCENEAARLFAASVLERWLPDPRSQQQASQSFQEGLERLQQCLSPGGLTLTPSGEIHRQRTQEALEHLHETMIGAMQGRKPAWFGVVQELAEELQRSSQIPRLPQRIQSTRDAFRVFHLDQVEARRQEAIWELEKRLVQRGTLVRVQVEGRMQSRVQSAYAASVLLHSEDERLRTMGWQAAQTLLRRFKPSSSSLPTLEAVSLLTLLETLLQQSQQRGGSFQLEESPWVQDMRIFAEPVEWNVRLHRPSVHQESISEGLEVGEKVILVVELPQGSEVGDELELFLPPELLWPEAEEEQEEMRFVMPASGTLQLSLVAASPTLGVHREVHDVPWGVRLVNQYREERGNASLDHRLRIWPHGERKRQQGRWKNPFRQLFG